TSARKRSLTRDQLSCSPFDIVFFSIRLKGGTDSVARPDDGTANAPETGRNNTRLMISSTKCSPTGSQSGRDERHRRYVEERCAFSSPAAEQRLGSPLWKWTPCGRYGDRNKRCMKTKPSVRWRESR